MKTIQIPDEYDMRAEVNNVLSCAYEGKDWMEDGSIRQDITDLKSNILDIDNDVDGLRVTIQELVIVTNRHDVKLFKHDVKLLAIATSLDTINQMLKILSKRVGLQDEPE